MSAGVRNTLIGCVIFMALVVTMFVLNVTRERGLSVEVLSEMGLVVLPRPRDIAPFNLTDANGEPFANEALQNRWTLVFFGFTFCPDICPTTLRDLAKAKPAINEALAIKGVQVPLQVVLVSVDPERDTLDRLREYVSYFDPDFRGVTGPLEQLATLATQLNAAFGKVPSEMPGGYTIDHSSNVVLINPKGHYHGFFRAPLKLDELPAAMAGATVNF